MNAFAHFRQQQKYAKIPEEELDQQRYVAEKLNVGDGDYQGNRVLTKEHLEEVVLDPTGFKPFTLDTPFESGFLLQHIEGANYRGS